MTARVASIGIKSGSGMVEGCYYEGWGSIWVGRGGLVKRSCGWSIIRLGASKSSQLGGEVIRSLVVVVNGIDPVSRMHSRPSANNAMPRDREKYSSRAS
jgi:hypothetical protein